MSGSNPVTISFDVKAATDYGVNAAIVLSVLEADAYQNTIIVICQKLPFLSKLQIRSALRILCENGLVDAVKKSENTFQRTLTYRRCDIVQDVAQEPEAAVEHEPVQEAKTENHTEEKNDSCTETKSEPEETAKRKKPVPIAVFVEDSLKQAGGIDDMGGDLQKSVREWLRYKAEKRQRYTPIGLSKLLSSIRKKAKAYGEDSVIEVINTSISNSWQGLFFDRLERKKKEEQSNSDRYWESWGAM